MACHKVRPAKFSLSFSSIPVWCCHKFRPSLPLFSISGPSVLAAGQILQNRNACKRVSTWATMDVSAYIQQMFCPIPTRPFLAKLVSQTKRPKSVLSQLHLTFGLNVSEEYKCVLLRCTNGCSGCPYTLFSRFCIYMHATYFLRSFEETTSTKQSSTRILQARTRISCPGPNKVQLFSKVDFARQSRGHGISQRWTSTFHVVPATPATSMCTGHSHRTPEIQEIHGQCVCWMVRYICFPCLPYLFLCIWYQLKLFYCLLAWMKILRNAACSWSKVCQGITEWSPWWVVCSVRFGKKKHSMHRLMLHLYKGCTPIIMTFLGIHTDIARASQAKWSYDKSFNASTAIELQLQPWRHRGWLLGE